MLPLIAPFLALALASPGSGSDLVVERLSLDAGGYGYGGRSAIGDWDGDGRPDAALAAGGPTLVAWAPVLFDSSDLLFEPGDATDAANLPSAAGADRLLLAGPAGLTVHGYHGKDPLPVEVLTQEACARVVVLRNEAAGTARVVGLGADGDALYVFEANSDGSFSESANQSLGAIAPVTAIVALDWNADGGDDLALVHATGVEFWDEDFTPIDATPLLAPALDVAPASSHGAAALLVLFEFPLYGYPDWQWLIEITPAGGGSGVSLGLAGYDILRAGDLNGDGVPDAVLADADAAGLDVLWGSPQPPTYDGSPVPAQLPLGPAAAHAVADLDNDGDLDVLAFHPEGEGLLVARGTVSAVSGLEFDSCGQVLAPGSVTLVVIGSTYGAASAEVDSYRVDSSSGFEVIDPEAQSVILPFYGDSLEYLAPADAWDEDVSYVLVIRPLLAGGPGPDVALDFPMGAACPPPPKDPKAGVIKTEGVDPRPRIELD